MKKLLVIINDILSDIIQKGEITDRYYNPKNDFDEVHIILTNNDSPDLNKLQRTVGEAKLFAYSFPLNTKSFFVKTLGFRPQLINLFITDIIKLIEQINPNLIRCYMNRINAYLAYIAKRKLAIPYLISLHGNPDVDYYRGRLGNTFIKKLYGKAIETIEVLTLKNADYIIPVYSPILPYLNKHNVENYEIVYNAVCLECKKKLSYEIDTYEGVKCVTVGRQVLNEKDPTPIIDAILELKDLNIHYTLIGNGNLHEELINRYQNREGFEKINFIKSMENDEVLKFMQESDFYLYSSVNYEISKTCIEAAIIGLPVIINDRNGKPAQELIDGKFYLVHSEKESYKKAILELINNKEKREVLARESQSYAMSHWLPCINEEKLSLINKRFML